MSLNTPTRILAILALNLAVTAGASAAPFFIHNGTLVGVNANSGQLVEYSFGGQLTESLTLSGGFSTLTGVQVIGSSAYVMGVGGDVSNIDLNTGATTLLFNGSGNEGLGARNGNLLTLNYSTGTVREFTVGGTLINTFAVQQGGTGVDGVGAGFAVGNYGDAKVRIYDASGALISTFATGVNPSEISDLAYDGISNNYWVSTGFGRHDIRSYDASGNLLSSFSVGGNSWINGLDVVESSGNPVPEPASLALFGLAGVFLIKMRRRKAK